MTTDKNDRANGELGWRFAQGWIFDVRPDRTARPGRNGPQQRAATGGIVRANSN
jgi:hypothetical protein